MKSSNVSNKKIRQNLENDFKKTERDHLLLRNFKTFVSSVLLNHGVARKLYRLYSFFYPKNAIGDHAHHTQTCIHCRYINLSKISNNNYSLEYQSYSTLSTCGKMKLDGGGYATFGFSQIEICFS